MVTCRSCGSTVRAPFLTVGPSPLANSYVTPEKASLAEPIFPLDLYRCSECHLVQLPIYESATAIFSDYAYFSSYSTTWLEHCRRFAERMVADRDLGKHSFVVEIASNDGYLLRNFVQREIPVLGIEPAANVAKVARETGVATEVAFFGQSTAQRLAASQGRADLIMGNNVLAHVPDVNDFVSGVAALLKADGLATFEFPHLLRMFQENQFDTIYHEHFSYFSLHSVMPIFERHGLRVADVEELATHGGSLRLHVVHKNSAQQTKESVRSLLRTEETAGVLRDEYYKDFADRVVELKFKLLTALIDFKRQGLKIAAYGAPAKGNTLLNYCGIRTELIPYTADRSPAKQGRLLPGTRIPIRDPQALLDDRPDLILILPWNLRAEIAEQLGEIRAWGGRFMVAIPEPTVF